MLSKISMKWFLPPLFVLPVVLIASVLIWLLHTTSLHTVDELSEQNTTVIHQRIKEHLTVFLDMPSAINKLNKRMLENKELSFSNIEQNRKSVFDILNIFPAVSSVVIGAQSGEVMWVIRYPGEDHYEYAVKKSPTSKMQEFPLDKDGNPGEMISEYEFNAIKRPWYRAAVSAGGPSWGEVYVWERNGKGATLGISYVEPIFSEKKELLGVINCELTLSDISLYLSKMRVGKTGRAFIVERDGYVIATSTNPSYMKDDVKRVLAQDAGDKWLARAYEILKNDSAIKNTKVIIDGKPIVLAASSYKNRRNLDWYVITMIPEEDFLAEINKNIKKETLLGLFAVLLMLLLSVRFSFWLIKPFLKLVEHVKRIGSGNLDETIELRDNLEFSQLSVALNDMMHDLQDRMQLRRSLTLAMEVQKNLLPTKPPQIKGLDIAGNSIYCDQTGGDYYDFLDVMEISDTVVVAALGDVMGHGVAAALLMATARGILRSHSSESKSLSGLMTHLNEHLAKDVGSKTGRFMTMLICLIDSASNQMRYVSAGHDAPIVYDPQTDSFSELELGQVPLGIMEDVEYQENVYDDIRSGKIIMLATDGVWEMQNEDGEMYGKERLYELIRKNASLEASKISELLHKELDSFRGSVSQDDDVTFVIVRVE